MMLQRNNKKSLGTKVALGAAALAFTAIAGTTTSSSAAVIVANQTYFFAPANADAESIPAGTVIKTQTDSFTGTGGVFSGFIHSEVITDATTGDNDFVYMVMNNASSPDSIDRLSLNSFSGFTTDVGYVLGNTDPFFATRSSDGSTVGFSFDSSQIQPGTNSDYLVVKTNSTDWVEGSGSVIDGGVGSAAVTVPTFGVSNGVPEPTTAALMSIASGMLMVRRRRR